MDRRTYLVALGSTLAPLTGCVGDGGRHGNRSTGGRDPNETPTNGSGSGGAARMDGDGSDEPGEPGEEGSADDAVTRWDGPGPGAWTQGGHDARHTNHASDATAPLGDVAVAWTAEMDRPVYAPVVDGHLFLTERWSHGAVHSLTGRRGEQRWTNHDLPPMRWAPALGEDAVYALTRTGRNVRRLHALDRESGEERWRTELTASSTDHPPSGPTLAGDRVYVGSDTGVIAVAAESGEEAWRAELAPHVVETEDGPTWATTWAKPAVDDRRVYTYDVTESYGPTREVYAVDRETGDEVWTAELDLGDDWRLTGRPVVAGAVVVVNAYEIHYVVPGKSDPPPAVHRLYAIDVADGSVAWRWSPGPGGQITPPAHVEGTLYVGARHGATDTGAIHAVDASDGTSRQLHHSESGGVGTPAVAEDVLYVTDGRGLAALERDDGSIVWRLSLHDPLTNPVVADGTVYTVAGGDRDAEENRVIAVRERA